MSKTNADPKPRSRQPGVIAERLGLLRSRHSNLDADISVEVKRRLPNTSKVQFLKRARLRTKDEITYLSGLLRTLSRPSDRSNA